MKPHFKPTQWDAMPTSARKCYLRMYKIVPAGSIMGWEWFRTFAEPRKMYALGPGGRWFVAELSL